MRFIRLPWSIYRNSPQWVPPLIFERKPLVKQPWQHPYYQDLLEGAGMSKAIDLYMWELQVDKRSDVAPMIWKVAEAAEQQHGVKLRKMRKRDLKEEVHHFVDVYN